MSTPPDLSAGEPPEDAESVQVPVAWPDISAMPLVYANQIGIGGDGSDFVLTFGQAFPKPLIANNPEEYAAAIAELGVIMVQPIARVVLSTSRARELLRILKRAVGDEEDA